MSSFSAFLKNPKSMRYEGEDDDEQILYLMRRSHVTNIPWILGLAFASVLPFLFDPFLASLNAAGERLVSNTFIFTTTFFWYLAVFGMFLFRLTNWFFNIYIITNKKIIDFDFFGLTYKNIADTSIRNIEDVTAKISGPFNMIFNIGDVYIQTAAEMREFDFESIDDPGKIRDVISDMIVRSSKHNSEQSQDGGPSNNVPDPKVNGGNA